MKTYIEHKFTIESLFFEYLNKGEDIEKLINGLNKVESIIRNGVETDANLWFQFDTLAYDINDIKKDLLLPIQHSNRRILIGYMKDAYSLYGDLNINFS